MEDQEKTPSRQSGSKQSLKDKQGRRPSLRDEVMEIDRDILKLLLKRHNLLEKMRKKGRLDPLEEKQLRENWQKEVSKVSRDASLSTHFFSLLQDMAFLPRPAASQAGAVGAQRREAFNLAPPRQPVSFSLAAPADSRMVRAWLYLAAAAGQACQIANSTLNDPVVDFIKAIVQAGSAISRQGPDIAARPAPPLGSPDKVIHIGDDILNFYLLLAHYLGRPSRAKFTGDSGLKFVDLAPLRRLLPELGARLVPVVPKTESLPARIECSGALPQGLTLGTDIPADFGLALLLAAPFYEQPFAVNLSAHPHRSKIMAQALPLLSACGIPYVLAGDSVSLEPCSPAIPANPAIPAQPDITLCLLLFAAVLGGEARLSGVWPDWPQTIALHQLLTAAGLSIDIAESSLVCLRHAPLQSFSMAKISPEILAEAGDHCWPLLSALAACAALAGGEAHLAAPILAEEAALDFLAACGLAADSSGKIGVGVNPPVSWNAPSPLWACALALAACARPKNCAGFQLGNPGLMTSLWPGFWGFYNNLPKPGVPRQAPAPADPKPRKRIITDVVAVPPEIHEEDWG